MKPTAERPPPADPPGRVRLPRCYADRPGDPCPCHHDPAPVWTPDPATRRRPCDHGFTTPEAGATTPGVHAPGIHQRGVRSDTAEALCLTCKAHRDRVRQETQ